MISANWGKEPRRKYSSEDMKSISSFFENMTKSSPESYYIDNITWNDLDMDNIFKKLNSTMSSVGEEYLYYLLRKPEFSSQVLEERERIIEFFRNNKTAREKLMYLLAKLGKVRSINITDYFYEENPKKSSKAIYYRLLAIMAGISTILAFIKPDIGIPLFILSFITNITIYYKTKTEIGIRLQSLSYILNMLNTAKSISLSEIEEISEACEKLSLSYNRAKNIGKKSYNLFYSSSDPLMEYIKIAFLSEIIQYETLFNSIYKHREDLISIYHIIGMLDSCIAIASYRNRLPQYAVPVLQSSKKNPNIHIYFKDLYHPLIKDPVANSLSTSTPVLITGSNASGKSTFLKTIAINAIFAQTIHTCLAAEYSSSFFKIYTSMALKDSIENGESYYIAEIKSLKRIIDSINSEMPLLCFVDEVLRGTNTIERIAASSQILYYISKCNCLCIAATHDLELTYILESHFLNYHFQEKITDNEIKFDYKLYEGRSNSRNAIKLLKFFGYDNSIVQSAEQKALDFNSHGKWSRLN